jgi:hypothetical protein
MLIQWTLWEPTVIMVNSLSSYCPLKMTLLNYRALGTIFQTWSRFKQRVAEAQYLFELWGSHLKRIEGYFGSGVASYFIFLKYLLLLNVGMFFVVFAFVTIPQVMYRYRQQEPPGYTQNVTFTGRELLTGGVCLAYSILFLDIKLFHNARKYLSFPDFFLLNLFLKGWFDSTELYYGYHFDGVINIFSTLMYNMQFAYILSCGAYYLLTVIILAWL